MRRPRRHANKNSFVTVIATLVATVVVGVAVYCGITLTMKAMHKEQQPSIEETAIEMLETGKITNRKQETHVIDGGSVRIDSYIVLYENQVYLVQFNAATGQCLTFCNYNDEGI